MSAPATPAMSSRHGSIVVSIGTKLAVATVGVLVVVSTLLFLELTKREQRSILASKERAAAMVADLFTAGVSAALDFNDTDGVVNELQNLKTNPELTCAAVWSRTDGKVLRHLDRGGCAEVTRPTDPELGTTKTRTDRLEVRREVVADGAERAKDADGSDVAEGATGAAGPGMRKAVGRVVLVFSLARENEAYAASRARTFWLSFVLAGGTAALLLLIVRRAIVSPLEKLSNAARHIGDGDFTTGVDIRSHDEIGELARAFNLMREALGDRERRLAIATQNLRDLFDNMRQAICAFGRDGRVEGEVSRRARTLFDRVDLQGESVRGLLYDDPQKNLDAQAFDEWLAMAFEMHVEQWSALEELAPHEATIARANKRPVPVELEFAPIVKDGVIERVMLLATDVSDKKQLEQTVATQEEEHGLRMAAMRRLIAGGGHVFVEFMEAARERIARCVEIIGPVIRTLSVGEIDELFRHIHTLKGEARAFDLRELEAVTAKLEEELDELRSLARAGGFATTGSVYGQLAAGLTRAAEAIATGCEIFVEASPIGRSALEQLTVQRPDVQSLSDFADRRGDPELSQIVARLAARAFGESTASLIDMAPTWADREGKRVHLVVEGREVRVPPRLGRVLGGVLTHLVRNAIAHGVETPSARTALGKDETGIIRAVATAGADLDAGPTVVVEDDGRGLDVTAIAERAVQLGIDVASKGRAKVSSLIFTAGFTTVEQAGQLAGRGVGLGAVRADLERVGYTIEVESAAGKYTRFLIGPKSKENGGGASKRAQSSVGK